MMCDNQDRHLDSGIPVFKSQESASDAKFAA